MPTYNPTVVYGTWPYPAYPPVYVPPPPGYAVASGLAAGLAFGAGVAITSALWGGFNWNTHDVNINVNRYNNINVNNRINSNTNTANWNRNSNVNRNTNNLNRTQNNLSGANRSQLDAYRGRDDSRAQARETLQNRTGQNVNGPASQRVQDIRQGGSTAGNRPGANGGGINTAGNRPGANGGGINNSDVRDRAQNVNRDNALRGAGDGNSARLDAQRGQASREALSGRQGGGGFGANGGGQQMHGGGFGAGGGGMRGGGGGGAHCGRHR